MMDRAIRNTAVLVLGMHRSGTSSVAGVLHRFGVDLGPNLGGPAADNLKGHFEHVEIVHLHEAILMALGSAWEDPSSFPSGWQHHAVIRPFRERLIAIILRDFGNSPLWGVKDPRLCRLLPLWLDVLRELDIDAKAVLVVRHPIEVAASLNRREGMDVEQAVMLWLSHVLSSEHDTREIGRAVVIYNDLLSRWQSEVQQMREILGIPLFAPSQQIASDVAAFLDVDLHHERDTLVPALHAPQNLRALDVFESMAALRHKSVSPHDVCAQAAEELAFASRAAGPIVSYVRSKALNLNAHLHAALQASFAARRSLEGQLLLHK